jgi:hypothetical protein
MASGALSPLICSYDLSVGLSAITCPGPATRKRHLSLRLATLLTCVGSGDSAALRGPTVAHPHLLSVFLAVELIHSTRRCKLVASPALRGLFHER